MKKVLITGWNTGFEKVAFTQMLQRELGYTLREAKAQTDAVMEDRTVELNLPDNADAFLKALPELGARFHLVASAAA